MLVLDKLLAGTDMDLTVVCMSGAEERELVDDVSVWTLSGVVASSWVRYRQSSEQRPRLSPAETRKTQHVQCYIAQGSKQTNHIATPFKNT